MYSFDHVAIHDKVTACDIKKAPLADEAQLSDQVMTLTARMHEIAVD